MEFILFEKINSDQHKKLGQNYVNFMNYVSFHFC